MDPKSNTSARKSYALDDHPSHSSKRSQAFRTHPREDPSSDRQGFDEPDQTFTGPSESFSSPTNFKACSEHFTDSHFAAPALNLELADLNDYLPYKHIDMPDDVKYDFNEGAPSLFLRHQPDSIDRLFGYNQRRDSFSEAIKSSTESA